MTLVSLSYVSAASRDMSENDLMDILETAREHNNKKNITGMLLYRNGYFIQALEGDDVAVSALYDKISRDERHRNVLTVSKQAIQDRSFSDWSMGFKNLDSDRSSKLEGFTDFLSQPYDKSNILRNSSRAVTLLELFKDGANY